MWVFGENIAPVGRKWALKWKNSQKTSFVLKLSFNVLYCRTQCSASDRLGDLVPQARARIQFPGFFTAWRFWAFVLKLSFNVLCCHTQANPLLSCISLTQRSGQVLSGLRTHLVRITLTCSQSDRCFLRMSISTSSVVSHVDWKACA